MFESFFKNNTVNDQEVREQFKTLSEKELLIEVLIELKKINNKCNDIGRKIVLWSD